MIYLKFWFFILLINRVIISVFFKRKYKWDNDENYILIEYRGKNRVFKFF